MFRLEDKNENLPGCMVTMIKLTQYAPCFVSPNGLTVELKFDLWSDDSSNETQNPILKKIGPCTFIKFNE